MNHLTPHIDAFGEEAVLVGESARAFFASSDVKSIRERLGRIPSYRPPVWRQTWIWGWAGWRADAAARGSALSFEAGLLLHEELGAAAAPNPCCRRPCWRRGRLGRSPSPAYAVERGPAGARRNRLCAGLAAGGARRGSRPRGPGRGGRAMPCSAGRALGLHPCWRTPSTFTSAPGAKRAWASIRSGAMRGSGLRRHGGTDRRRGVRAVGARARARRGCRHGGSRPRRARRRWKPCDEGRLALERGTAGRHGRSATSRWNTCARGSSGVRLRLPGLAAPGGGPGGQVETTRSVVRGVGPRVRPDGRPHPPALSRPAGPRRRASAGAIE